MLDVSKPPSLIYIKVHLGSIHLYHFHDDIVEIAEVKLYLRE